MKALIVDDEPMPAKYLQELINQNCFEIDSTKLAISAEEGIKYLKNESVDILFLDVEMNTMTGFDLLKKVNIDSATKIIFTTAYSEYAVDAFRAGALDYLVKPIQKDELISAVRKVSKAKILNKRNESKKSIFVYLDEEYINLKVDEIIRFEADGSYTKIVCTTNTQLSSKPLGFYEAEMLELGFIRCHNSHLINVEYIAKIGKGKSFYLELSNEDIIPVSASKKDALKARLRI